MKSSQRAPWPLIAAPEVLQIPVQGLEESLVRIRPMERLHISNLRKPENPHCAWVRRGVSRRLVQASQSLPEGLILVVEEGYRSLAQQQRLYEGYCRQLQESNPSLSAVEIHQEAMKYVAPPDDGAPHSTGGAVDVALSNSDGGLLPMGSTSCDTPEEVGDRGFTESKGIGQEEHANRMILIDAMSLAGFENYPYEWWHWSFGDRYWALAGGHGTALYGVAPEPGMECTDE